MNPSSIDLPAEQSLGQFALGQHRVELRAGADGSLSLWLDGCERKRRGTPGSPVYLWTNVELPFEDHHLVEVRRSEGPSGEIRVTENGHPVQLEALQSA